MQHHRHLVNAPFPLSVRLLFLLVFLLVFPLVLLWSNPAAAEVRLTEFVECQLQSLDGPTQRSAECATLTVPLDPAAPDGASLALYVARISSLSRAPLNDPLVLINGGPGGSSVELYLQLANAFNGVLDQRDILILDQRGTGRSEPLQCELDTANPDTADDVEQIRADAMKCLAALPADPRFFNTSIAVGDLEALREAAGYRQFNLYGVSYGTRVAQHFARRYPSSTRSLILDGVVPPTEVLGPNIALNAQQALDSILERCASEANCAAAFPDLAGEFTELSQRLHSAPPTIDLPHPVTGQPEQVTLYYSYLALVTRLMSYAPESSALLPLMVHQANKGDYRALAGQALSLTHQLSSSLSYGMHNAVVCSEDAPRFDALNATLDRAALAATYIGSSQYAALEAVCAEWPAGPTDDDFGEPFVSALPVLVLSGEHDPITPPGYGELLLPHLSNAHHIVAPGQGHGVIGRGCLPRIARSFIEDNDLAATRELAAQCTGQMRAMPFFVNAMGPVPAADSGTEAQADSNTSAVTSEAPADD